jgi:hypothetical protein
MMAMIVNLAQAIQSALGLQILATVKQFVVNLVAVLPFVLQTSQPANLGSTVGRLTLMNVLRIACMLLQMHHASRASQATIQPDMIHLSVTRSIICMGKVQLLSQSVASVCKCIKIVLKLPNQKILNC